MNTISRSVSWARKVPNGPAVSTFVPGFRPVRDRRGAGDRLAAFDLERPQRRPDVVVRLRHIERGIVERVGRRGNLNERASEHVGTHAVGRLQDHFPDQRRQRTNFGDRALKAFRAEQIGRYADIHVATQHHLTRQPQSVAQLMRCQFGRFGRQRLAPAFSDGHATQPAGTGTRAGRGNEYVLSGQHGQQLATGFRRDLDRPVHRYSCRPRRIEKRPRADHHRRQNADERDEKDAAEDDLGHPPTPAKAAKPSDMRPVTRKALPRPRRPCGMSEYLSRSRMAAKVTIASAQPVPLPKP